jgi:hypothetical protein
MVNAGTPSPAALHHGAPADGRVADGRVADTPSPSRSPGALPFMTPGALPDSDSDTDTADTPSPPPALVLLN